MSDLISRQDAICAVCGNCLRTDLEVLDGCLGEDCSIKPVLESLPSAELKIDDENELKFYYVESLDDYWVGRRLDNFYYATWHGRFGFIWSHSKYLPWGEHIVDENTLWKEHTYPSEPIEISFTEWIVGFVKKYYAEPKTGGWIPCSERLPEPLQEVIVTSVNGHVYTSRVVHGEFEYGGEVIAWMPLPEPYEEEE